MTDAALRVLAGIVARLPRGAIAPLGAALGFIAGSLLRIRRRLVEAAMRRAGVVDPSSSARRMYRGLGLGVLELLSLAGARSSMRDEALASAPLDDAVARALLEGLARGPVIVFASHTGNWELGAASAARLLGAHGKKVVVVAKTMHAGGVHAFTARLRAAFGIRVVSPAGALASARHALASGDLLVMPIDQVPDRSAHGMSLPFLGATALVDRAPATLAWRTRATVVVTAGHRIGDTPRLRLLGIVPPPDLARRDARAWIEETTAFATARLEAFVETTPESWLWLHRRWRMPRRELVRGERLAEWRPGLVATRKAG